MPLLILRTVTHIVSLSVRAMAYSTSLYFCSLSASRCPGGASNGRRNGPGAPRQHAAARRARGWAACARSGRGEWIANDARAFLLAGFLNWCGMAWMLLPAGTLLLVAAYVHYSTGRRYKREWRADAIGMCMTVAKGHELVSRTRAQSSTGSFSYIFLIIVSKQLVSGPSSPSQYEAWALNPVR